MSVQTEISRLESAKQAIATAIADKGVTVPDGTMLDGMAALIDTIPEGTEPVLQDKTATPSTSAQTVSPDSGYDGLASVTVNAMPAGSVGTPSISVNSSTGVVTATAAVDAGYVDGTDKAGTLNLTTKAAATITPGTSNQTIAAGTYLTGNQTIAGDADLKAENIKSGVNIFGVTGTHSGGFPNGTEWTQSHITSGNYVRVAFGNGIWVASSNNAGLYYSTDGKTWTQSNVTSTNANAVAYANGIWVAGDSYNNTGLYYSSDGKTWTQSNVASECFYDVVNANGIWVTGSGCNTGIYYSVTWEPAT